MKITDITMAEPLYLDLIPLGDSKGILLWP